MFRARALFEQAIEPDAENGLAYSGLAFTFGTPFYLVGLERDADRASELARPAVEIDPHDAFASCLVGAAEMWNGRLDEAERHVKRSIALNPGLALAAMHMSSLRSRRCDVDGAGSWARRAKELNPADPGSRAPANPEGPDLPLSALANSRCRSVRD